MLDPSRDDPIFSSLEEKEKFLRERDAEELALLCTRIDLQDRQENSFMAVL